MRRAPLFVLVAIVLSSCTVVRKAEVLVTVDAEPGVVSAARSLQIRMWGRPANGDFNFDDMHTQTETGIHFPWTVALRPQDEDDSRIYLFEATAFTGTLGAPGNFVSQARVSSGYEPGQILHVYVLLQDACIGVPCEQLSESCRNGRCEEIPMEAPTFDPDAGFPDAAPPLGDCMPGAPELCDHMDNDCDRRVDEGIDFRNDPSHCGACENDCDQPHATASCVQGGCEASCDEGYADCDDGVPGCETSLLDDHNCGGCGVVCSGSTGLCGDPDGPGGEAPRCVASCPSGQTQCGSSCVDTSTSLDHCGRCDNACGTFPHVNASCTGTCTYDCVSGYMACDGQKDDDDGCEVHTAGDVYNCGGCNQECPQPDPGCGTATCDGECAIVGTTVGATCDADGDSCTRDTCDAAGRCVSGPMICDAGTGFDAGAGCGGGMPCSAGNMCCGGSCCPAAQCCGTMCCGADQTCDGGICRPRDAGSPPCDGGSCTSRDAGGPRCDGGSCGPRDAGWSPPDGGGDAGLCGGSSCPMPSDACCGGVTCCETSLGYLACCGNECCDMRSNSCNLGVCEPRATDAGTDACGGCADVCCDDGSGGGWCCGPGETCVTGRTCAASGSDPCGGFCSRDEICCPSGDGSTGWCCGSGTSCGFGGTCSGDVRP